MHARTTQRRNATTASKAAIRETQRAWLKQAVEISGLSPSALAIEAGVSDSTLTRFLNKEDYAGSLSPLTIERIAEIAGVPAPGNDTNSGRGFRDDGAPYQSAGQDEVSSAVAAFLGSNPNRYAWEIRNATLVMAGVRPGDIVITDAAESPAAGDIVIAQIESGAAATTVFRLFQPPMLTGAATDPAAIRPEIVDGVRVRIAGVVVATIRRRTPA